MVNDSIGKDLLVLSNYLKRKINERTRKEGISPQIGRILIFVLVNNEHNITVYQKMIEKGFNSAKSSLSEILSRMENQNFIVKHADEKSRSQIIILTEHGKKLAKKCKKIILEIENSTFDLLGKDESIEFRSQLHLLTENIIKEEKRYVKNKKNKK